MYFKAIVFLSVLLVSHIDEISCEEENGVEDSAPDDQSSSPHNHKTNPKDYSSQRAISDCPKNCHKNKVRKSQSHCSLVNYKISEKANSIKQCIEKCKTYAICGSALFVKPRSITTLDLNKLFTKVIDSENWVSINEPETLLKYYRQINKEKRKEKMIEPENDDDFEHFSQVNSSAHKGVGDVSGFCYIYSDQMGVGETVKCTQSHLTFTYEEIDCIEDQKCVDKRPRKQCTRGKCGKTCNEFNTIHIPNACIGKYFFGHLEADNLQSCLEFCLSDKNCKSVDFGNMGSCLLNYVNRNDTQLIIGCDSKNNEIWDYYEIIEDSECFYEKPKPSPHEDTCLNVPGICKNGGNCEAVQLPPPHQDFTYDCNCPCNWCGKHCDKLNMKTFRNGCLNSSALVWSVAESSSDCIDMCLDEIHCKSVSYSSTSGTCVLHWADQHTDPLIASPKCPTYRTDVAEKEWTFFEIICNSSTCHSTVEVIQVNEMKGCSSNPCLNGGECADIFEKGKIGGYHCLCRCGYCGDRCESHNSVQTENACIWKSHISDNPSDFYRKSVSLNTCLDVCSAKFPLCRSVDYSDKGECLLNNNDSESAKVTEGCNNYMRQRWSLYDLSCVCNNKPVIY